MRPRPRGRSGWEITSPTSWSEASRPPKIVAAKAGVPANANFTTRVRVLPAGQHAFADLTHSCFSGLAVGTIQYEDAVEVVYFVLEDAG